MKFRNINKFPRHNSVVHGTILPGRETRDYDGLLKELKKIVDDPNFEIVLTQEEEDLLDKVIVSSSIAKKRDPKTIDGYYDPYGIKAAKDKEKEHRKQVAQVRSELFEKVDNKIIQRQDRVISDAGITVEPKIIEDKPKSLAEIIGHNQAIKEQSNE